MDPRYYALYSSYLKNHRLLHPEPNRWAIRVNNVAVITIELKHGELQFDFVLI